MVPIGPVRYEIRVRNQHTGCVFVRLKYPDRFTGLHEESLVVVEVFKRCHDPVEIIPRARSPADAAINHQLMGTFGNIGMQVVHQHPHRCLGHPAFCADLGTGRGEYVALVVAGIDH